MFIHILYGYKDIFPRGLVVRIPPSHGGGRGSIPRTGNIFPFHLSNLFIFLSTHLHMRYKSYNKIIGSKVYFVHSICPISRGIYYVFQVVR